MKRYFVFLSHVYYPSGLGDLLLDTDELSEAEDLIMEEVGHYDFGEVLDTKLGVEKAFTVEKGWTSWEPVFNHYGWKGESHE